MKAARLKIAVIWVLVMVSCIAVDASKYAANLEKCNREAKTLCESIACENVYREAEQRKPRTTPAHCKDAGGDANERD